MAFQHQEMAQILAPFKVADQWPKDLDNRVSAALNRASGVYAATPMGYQGLLYALYSNVRQQAPDTTIVVSTAGRIQWKRGTELLGEFVLTKTRLAVKSVTSGVTYNLAGWRTGNGFAAVSAGDSASAAFNLTNRGVQATLNAALQYFTELQTAVRKIDPAGKVILKSSGALQFTLGGHNFTVAPWSYVSSATSLGGPVLYFNQDGTMCFRDSHGATQLMMTSGMFTAMTGQVVSELSQDGCFHALLAGSTEMSAESTHAYLVKLRQLIRAVFGNTADVICNVSNLVVTYTICTNVQRDVNGYIVGYSKICTVEYVSNKGYNSPSNIVTVTETGAVYDLYELGNQFNVLFD